MKTPELDIRDPNFYNAIINSNMTYHQRLVGNSVTRTQASLNGGYDADRFNSGVSPNGASKSITLQRSTNVPSGLIYPASYSRQLTNNTVVASFPAAEYIYPLLHNVEGYVFAPLYGKPMTLGFWFYSSVGGTVSVAIRGATGARSYVTTISSTPSTWEFFVVNVPFDTSGDYGTLQTGLGVDIVIGGVGGTNYQPSSLNQWGAGSKWVASTATNWAATSGAVLRFAQMQLRSGTLSKQEMLDSYCMFGGNEIGELRACQRYYEKSYSLGTVPGTATTTGMVIQAAVNASNQLRTTAEYKVVKRIENHVFICYSTATGAINTVYDNNASVDRAQVVDAVGDSRAAIAANGATANQLGAAQWTADAEF